ncbi:hypothetical protein BJ875DRAFT_446421 [Amylocarpus encephaloides]|uniref:Uncharacterized protein n=1 Tax=Amylocarpus encephaloides TaxID=45428 RepID=A0A9P7Y8S7_9HELO|nr:hypothetical protein BJ875DRAFT_446421 [Amylocarpus encephaloides]
MARLKDLMEERVGQIGSSEEVATLDSKKEQESGVTISDEPWLLVKTQRDESVASPCVSDDNHHIPAFPQAVFHLEAYKLVYACLPKVPPHEKILVWLRGVVVRSKGTSPTFPTPARIENSPESGRIQLDGYDFNSYILVRISDLGQCAQNLDNLGNLDQILSITELEDESWELPVRKSSLPKLKDALYKMVPNCVIESGYDPTEPNANEVKEFGYERARILKTIKLRDRAEHMMR